MVNSKRALTSAVALWLAFMLSALAIATAQEAPPPSQPGSTQGTAQVPQPDSGVNWSGAGYGGLAIVSNLLYVPAKLVYGMLGGFVGGCAWMLTGGNSEVSDTIWRSSLGGDYLVTPQMISGDQPLHFNGPTKTEELGSLGNAAPQPGSPAPLGSVAPQPGSSAPLGSAAPQPGSSAPPSPSASSAGAGPLTLDRGTGPVGPAPAAAAGGANPVGPAGATAPPEPEPPNIE